MSNENTKTAVALAVVTGSALKAGVGPGRKFEISEFGEINFLGDMKFEEYLDLLSGLKRVSEKYHLVLGSAVRYGNGRFGPDKVQEALRQMEFPHLDATRALAIGQLELSFSQTPKLEPDHYWVLASLCPDDPKKQALWAAAAEKHSLTALELKNSIAADKIVKDAQRAATSGRGSGQIGTFEAFELYFTQWERRMGGRQAILEGGRDVKEKFLQTTQDIADLRAAVEASLVTETAAA